MSEQTWPTRGTRIGAVAMSLCGFAGWGHVLLGRWWRGLGVTAAYFVPIWLTPLVGGWGLVLWPLLWIAAAVDVAFMRPAARPTWGHRIVAWGVLLAVVVVLALVTRTFYVEAFKIPSGAMLPTLEVGDHIFIDKLSSPGRGDLVVFPYPQNPSQDFVKRIVAIGGDTLEVRHNQVVLNGAPQPRERVAGPCSFTDWDLESRSWLRDQPCVLFDESIDGHAFISMDLPDPRPTALRDFGPIKVPDGEAYVMGDNRDNSHDSRYWGGVPLSSIRGTAYLVWWSKGPDGVRWGRIGHRLR